VLRGTSEADVICGLGGNDRITVGAGDVAKGGAGADRIISESGGALVVGGSGSDRLSARNGEADIVAGGSGADRVRADRRDLNTEARKAKSREGRTVASTALYRGYWVQDATYTYYLDWYYGSISVWQAYYRSNLGYSGAVACLDGFGCYWAARYF
jgi:hypothetical protein